MSDRSVVILDYAPRHRAASRDLLPSSSRRWPCIPAPLPRTEYERANIRMVLDLHDAPVR